MTTMNRETYEKLIAENLEWLMAQPHSLEREHIALIVRRSAMHEYKPTDTPHTPEWMRQTEQLRGELLDMCYAEQFKRWWMAYDMSGGHSSEQVAKAAWIEATRVAKNRTEVGGKHEQNPYGFGELIDEESK